MPLRSYRARTAALCAAALLAATLQTATAAAVPPRDNGCVSTGGKPTGQARQVLDIVRKARSDLDLKAALVRVTQDGRDVATFADGESMSGVPATPAMHFRSGSVAIAFMGTALLRLVDEHRVSLDDPVSRWLPTCRTATGSPCGCSATRPRACTTTSPTRPS